MNKYVRSIWVFIFSFLCVFVFLHPANAGSLIPPGSVTNTLYTLTDLFNLSTGATTTEGSGNLPATPGVETGTMKTITEVYNALQTQVLNITTSKLKVGTTAFGVTGSMYLNSALKTNQTTCYDGAGSTISCTGTGQDGELKKGLSVSYTDNSNGTITDNQTGLVWQKGTTTTYTWTDALSYCNNNTAGLPGTGWHLPNILELFNLLDFMVSNWGVPKINATYFPGTPNDIFWSSTTYTYNGALNYAMHVNFSGDMSYSTKPTLHYVRCVR